jgi:hypothetical protein
MRRSGPHSGPSAPPVHVTTQGSDGRQGPGLNCDAAPCTNGSQSGKPKRAGGDGQSCLHQGYVKSGVLAVRSLVHAVAPFDSRDQTKAYRQPSAARRSGPGTGAPPMLCNSIIICLNLSCFMTIINCYAAAIQEASVSLQASIGFMGCRRKNGAVSFSPRARRKRTRPSPCTDPRRVFPCACGTWRRLRLTAPAALVLLKGSVCSASCRRCRPLLLQCSSHGSCTFGPLGPAHVEGGFAWKHARAVLIFEPSDAGRIYGGMYGG